MKATQLYRKHNGENSVTSSNVRR